MALEALQLRNDRRIVTLALALLLIPHLWFVRTDFTLYADDWPRLRERLLIRAMMVSVSLVGIALVRLVDNRRAYENVVLGIALALAGGVVGLIALRPQDSELPLRTPLMILIVLYGALPNRFWRQVIPPLLLSMGLALLRLTWVTGSDAGGIGGDLVVIGLINAVGMVMVRRRRALERDLVYAWEAEHAARTTSERTLAELRVLHGIIPICAHCRKVRTEVGDWEQIEAYVRSHTSADFSHGICPACLEKHFPLGV
ncbi:MAG TPA: hypothetical protein VF981_09055 [Gemmatimonadaceae bacterium]